MQPKVAGDRMQLTVNYIEEGEAKEELLIKITYRRKELCSEKIITDGMSLNEVTEAKKQIISTFCKQHEEFDFKDVLLAFSKIDESMQSYYKKLYPHGGYRGGGRPRGSKTERTEYFNRAVTPDEREYLIKCLEEYRRRNGK